MLLSIYKFFSFLCIILCAFDCFCYNIEELKAINYEVDILQTPMKKEEVSQQEPTLPIVQVTSVFGQEYQCILPQVEEEEISEKITFSEKNADIKQLLMPMHTGNCLLKAKDWWTYELCFGQYIKQFHIEDGQIIGQVLTLGLYDSDYDWSNETEQEKFKHLKQRYHSQYYVNGTKCDLTGQPRVTEVRIFCEEDSGDYIHRVDEPGTCSYVIAVHTSRVCSHPQLKPLPSKKIHTIPCHPLLTEVQYSHYLEKLHEEKAVADQKRSQWLNNQQERLQVMKSDNSLAAENDDYFNFVEDKGSDFNLNELSVNKIESIKGNLKAKHEKEQLFKSEAEPKSITNEHVEEAGDFEDYDKELESLKSFLSPAKFAMVKSNIEEFYESIINEIGKSEEIEKDDDAAYEKFTSSLNKLLKKLNKAEKDITEATKNLNKDETAAAGSISEKSISNVLEVKSSDSGIGFKKSDINEEIRKESDVKTDNLLNENEEEDSDDLQVRIRRLDRMYSNGKVYEIDRVQQKKLEKAIKEKLEKYGVNTGGRRIEVKIFKAGYYDSHLTDEEASQFENMITALLTGEQEAIQEMERNKKLEENYKFTWNNNNDEEETN